MVKAVVVVLTAAIEVAEDAEDSAAHTMAETKTTRIKIVPKIIPTPTPIQNLINEALGTLTGPQTRPAPAIGPKAVGRPTVVIPLSVGGLISLLPAPKIIIDKLARWRKRKI